MAGSEIRKGFGLSDLSETVGAEQLFSWEV